MKTKVLIPSVLLLSAVSGLAFGKANVRTFIETTDAQEQIFGEVEEVKSIKQDTKKKVNAPEADYKVGFQSQTHDGYVDIRFVAAINVENLADVTASWTRTVYNETLEVAKTEANIPVTKAYASLTINDVSVTAASLGYDYFVVYVMRNIPQDTAADYYVDAYLTINEAGGEPTTTDIYSVKGDASSAITYKSTDITYFATYNYPSAEDDGKFVAKKARVVDGKTVAESAPNTNDITISITGTPSDRSNKNNGTYSFQGWFTGNDYLTAKDTDEVKANGAYYAKYTCANTLYYYDGSHLVYTAKDVVDETIVADAALYGERILGYSSYNNQNATAAFVTTPTTISLTSSSGIYKLTRNGTTDWTIQRKVGISYKLQYEADWWFDAGRVTAFWMWEDGKDGVLSDVITNPSDYIFVDAKYTNFKAVRGLPENLTKGATTFPAVDNQTVNYRLIDGNKYSSTNLKLHIYEEKTYDKNNLNWGE